MATRKLKREKYHKDSKQQLSQDDWLKSVQKKVHTRPTSEQLPPELEALWTRIEGNLPMMQHTESASNDLQKRNKKALWLFFNYRVASIAAAFVLLLGLGFFFYRYQFTNVHKRQSQESVAKALINTEKEALRTEPEDLKKSMPVDDASSHAVDEVSKSSTPAKHTNSSSVSKNQQASNPVPKSANKEALLDDVNNEPIPSTKSTQIAQVVLPQTPVKEEAPAKQKYTVGPPEATSSSGSVTENTIASLENALLADKASSYIALEKSNVKMTSFGSFNLANGNIPNRASSDVCMRYSSARSNYELAMSDEPAESPFLYDNASFVHYLPFQIGAGLSFEVVPNVTLETGIRYTLLMSSVSNYLPGTKLVQHVHYLGVPLQLDFNFYKFKQIGLYGGAGIGVDKVIYSGLARKNLYFYPWQLSINLHVGMEYNIVPELSLYIQPAVNYYLNDGTRLQTYYKDNPVNFMLSMGVRFNAF